MWWRPIPTVRGLVCLLPLLREDPTTVTYNHQNQLIAGVILMLVGIVVVLPWVVDATVSRLRGWSVASQLAARNLQAQAASSARIVSGIAVAIAGAIALQMLLTIASSDQESSPVAAATAGNASVTLNAAPQDVPRHTATLRGMPGVESAWLTQSAELRGHGQGDGAYPMLVIGDCATLRGLTNLTSCDDAAGTVVRAASTVGPARVSESGEQTTVPRAGERVKVFDWTAHDSGDGVHAVKLRLPSDLQDVRVRAGVDGWPILGSTQRRAPCQGSRTSRRR